MKARSLILLLFALLLTACRSSLMAELVTAPGDELFRDDFSDPATGSWPQVTDVNSVIGFYDDSYRMVVTTPNYQTWAVSGHAYRNVRVEADMVRNTGPVINLMGLVCRYVDAGNFYFFVISNDGYFGLGKFQAGSLSLIGQEMMASSADILPEGINHLRLECNGSTLTGYVNGTLVALGEDDAFAEGDTGLLAGTFDEPGVDVSFDNFVVIKP